MTAKQRRLKEAIRQEEKAYHSFHFSKEPKDLKDFRAWKEGTRYFIRTGRFV